MRIRIYYEDTDAGGVVYYANYLRYLERDRMHFFGERGVDILALHASGVEFVVARVDIEYKAPARLGDELEVRTRVAKLSRLSMELQNEIIRTGDGRMVASAKVKLGCIGPGFALLEIPNEVRRALEAGL